MQLMECARERAWFRAGQNRDDGDDDQKLDQREVPDFPVHGEYLSVIG